MSLEALFGLGSGGLVQEAAGIIAAQVDCKLLPDKYDINSSFRNLMPSFGPMLDAWVKGAVNDDALAWCAAFNNISLNKNAGNVFQKTGGQLWQGLVTASSIQLSWNELLAALWMGIIDLQTFNDLTKDHRLRRDHANVFKDMARGKYSFEEMFTLYNRGFWKDEELTSEIRRSHSIDKPDAEDLATLAKLIPPPSELTRFLVRHVWEPDIRQVLGLDDEYDRVKKAIPWFNAVGMYDNMSIPGDGNTDPVDWIKAEWAVHWKAMSPEQAFVAHQRLRPGAENRWKDIAPNASAFTDDILNKTLRMDDYVPKMRDWLTAISYRIIGIRQLKILYEKDIIDRQEVTEIWKDQGYQSRDALRLTEMLDAQKKDDKDKETERNNNKKYSKFRTKILDAYREGSVDRTTAETALASTGLKDEVINGEISSVNIDVNRRLIQQFIKMVKDEFMLGGSSPTETVASLVAGGVSSERANQYVILWQRQLGRPRRTAQAEKLIDWFAHGYLSTQELSRRLSILGFSNGDILVYNAEASRKLDENVARIEAAQARTIRQQIEATEKMLRQARADRRSAQAQMRTYSGLVQMRKWFIDGEIEEPEVRDRMTFLDIPTEDQDRYIFDWNVLRGA